MHIVHVAAEMAPLAKVGGLGDLVGGLVKELGYKENVEIIIPHYSFLKEKGHAFFFKSSYGKCHENQVNSFFIEKTKVSLLKPKINYFNRPNIYGYKDDCYRFTYFSQAVLEYLFKQNKAIDILHIHDWHTSICAVLYKQIFHSLGLKIKKIVLNIHNLQYQGTCFKKLLHYLDLKKKQKFNTLFKINLLKAGILYSDTVVAVSKTYIKEMLTKKNGYGLDKTLKQNKKKLIGILNGIDTNIWNPETDKYIKNYDKHNLHIKNQNTQALKIELGLSIEKKPLICFIGRLVFQKGIDLLIHCIKKNKDYQFILLGSSPIKKIQKKFLDLKKRYENKHISINLKHDEILAHKIYAAADFILIPSLFEPCGLVQMIALKYGTIPIARKTGGLADTVFDVDNNEKIANGFTFEKFNKKSLDATLVRALNFWQDKNKFNALQQKAMQINHSLKKTSEEYLDLYKKLICLNDPNPSKTLF